MENALALGITVPKIEPNTGFVNALLAASQIKSAESSNALHQMQLEQFQTNQNALKDYNARMNAGDPEADKALAGAPDMLHKVTQIKSIQTDEARKHALWSATENADGARRVAALQPGPERDQAWNAELDRALKEKRITPETYKNSYGKPVNELMLQNAIRMGLSVEQYVKLQQSDEDRKYSRGLLGNVIDRYRQGGAEPAPGETVSSGGGSALGGIPGMGDNPQIASYPGMPAAGAAASRVAQAPAAPAPTAEAPPVEPGSEPGRPVMSGPLTTPQRQSSKQDLVPMLIAAAGGVGIPDNMQKTADTLLKHELKSDELIRAAKQRLQIALDLEMDPKSESFKQFVGEGKYDDKMRQRAEVMTKYGIDPHSPAGEKFALTGEYNNDVDRRAVEAKKFGFKPGTANYNEFVIEGKYTDEQKKREDNLMAAGVDIDSPAAKQYRLTGTYDNVTERRRQDLRVARVAEDSEDGLRYVFTGKWPGEDKMSPATSAKIAEAEDKIIKQSEGLRGLNRASVLNPHIFQGFAADKRAWITTQFPDIAKAIGPETFKSAEDTQIWRRNLESKAITSMADTLKGPSTDFEMRKFISIMADPTRTLEDRREAVEGAQRLVIRDILRNGDYVDQLREKTYHKPQYGRVRLMDIKPEVVTKLLTAADGPDAAEYITQFNAKTAPGMAQRIIGLFD